MRPSSTDVSITAARWIARNRHYRIEPQTFTLPADLDRHGIRMNVQALSPKPWMCRRSAPQADRFGPVAIADSARHLTIDGCDRAMRRWVLQRARWAMCRLHVAIGMIIAVACVWLITNLSGDVGAALLITIGCAGALAIHSLARMNPLDRAASEARDWVEHMPRQKAAPRYWRLYESN